MFFPISASSDMQLQCAQTFSKHKYPAATQPMWNGERYRHDKIRVAYLSADFRNHAVAYLTAELFEAHDKSRFETIAISFGPEDKDQMRTRLETAFSRFIDVRSKNDHGVALLLKDLEIDTAGDLMR